MINYKTNSKKILIVVDYQYDFVSTKGALPVKNAKFMWRNIQKRIDDPSYENIIYTFDTHEKEEYFKSEESKTFPNIHCEFGTKGWWLYKISPRNKEIKRFYNNRIKPCDIVINDEFFFVKDLFSIWEGNKGFKDFFTNGFDKDTQIDVCGVAEDVCVSMFVIGLIENGFTNVNVISECVKGINIEETKPNVDKMKSMNNVTYV